MATQPSRPTPAQVLAASASPARGSSRPPAALASSAAIYGKTRRLSSVNTERHSIAKEWQVEAYRHVNICGEARYAATLFSSIAGRAELGVSEPQSLGRKATFISEGPEVSAMAELCPTVRDRAKLIRDYMLHRVIAGECYLIARERVPTDPGYVDPPEDPATGKPYDSWDEYLRVAIDLSDTDLFDPDGIDGLDLEDLRALKNPNVENPLWEIVAVTEIRRVGKRWKVRHENGNYIDLSPTDPVIRLWSADPENRMEAWSPFRSLLPTLKEIEWLTAHIFSQVKSRLMAAGVWFLPNNLTFPPPPPESVEGGAEALAAMNEAEQFMVSLAASSMDMLDATEVSFPSIVMADPVALANIDQQKLIQFWSEIDDKAMTLRGDAVRRFALGMDLPPEQVLGSSGMAVSGSASSAGSSNHWAIWANEEQTISAHIEPALDDFVGALTSSFLRLVVEGTDKVVAYDTASLRLRQDRSKEALEWYDRGGLKLEVALRETGFDPENDMMDGEEFKRWLLVKIAGGSATPEQVNESLRLLGVVLNTPSLGVSGNPERQNDPAPGQPGRNNAPSLEDHPYEGPPRVDHEHNDAPYSALHASCEVLVLRALEKAGNRLLNDGKRGKDRDRTTPAHMAHVVSSPQTPVTGSDFDFTLSSTVFGDLTAAQQEEKTRQMRALCAELYNTGSPYTREALIEAVKGV